MSKLKGGPRKVILVDMVASRALRSFMCQELRLGNEVGNHRIQIPNVS